MKPNKSIRFQEINSCNACGADTIESKVLGSRLDKQQGWKPWNKTGVATTVCQCIKCGLIYANPLPTLSSLEETYAIDPADYWNVNSLSYDSNEGYFSREVVKAVQLLRLASPSKSNLRALDIGAGAGKAMRALMDHNFAVDGIEPIPSFREVAIKVNNINPENIIVSTIEEFLPLKEYYDFITFGAVLEHLQNPFNSLLKAYEALAPGGIIHAEVPNSNWLIAQIADMIYRLRITHYTTHLSPLHSPFHLYEFTDRSLIALAKRLGLEIASLEFLVCSQPNIPSIAQPLLRRIMHRTNSGMQISVFLRK